MTKIEEIAARYGAFLFEYDGIVLCEAGDTHWFATVRAAKGADALADGDREMFYDECDSLRINGAVRPKVDTLLDNLRAARPDRYATLGGSHEAIIAGAV